MAPTEPSSKRTKLGTKLDQNGIDRLSNLPNPIRINILSFLPTEAAVATAVLSKRWRSLWTLVPNLDFDESRHKRATKVVPTRSSQHPYSSRILPDRRFEDFVTKVLLRRRVWSLRRLRLKVHSRCDPSDLDLWVSSAIVRDVQELELHLVHSLFLALPRTLQSCKTLRVLKLTFVSINGRLGKICFPNLKVLHLKRVELERREVSLVGFLSSRKFPLLEELVLEKYSDKYDDDTKFEISFPNLSSLGIEFYPGSEPLGRKFTLSIDCPALRHFDLTDHTSREFHLGDLCNLVEAGIDISNIMHSDHHWCDRLHSVRENGDAFYGRYVMNVIKAISNVTTLSLSNFTMREIQRASSYSFFRWKDIPIFHNLVKVELTLEGSSWENLVFMLHKFENLKYLTLCTPSYDGVWIQPTIVPNCLTFHVATLCFRGFQGSGDEMKAAKYILEKSHILEKMTFLFSSSLTSEDGSRILRELSKSPKGSVGCKFYKINYRNLRK